MNKFNLLGIYQVVPSVKSIATAVIYHKYYWLVNQQGEFIDDVSWDNFKNLGLLEFQISGNYLLNDLIKISQGDQVPYMEFYLDKTGTHLLEESEAIYTEGRRVCFFLHFIDITVPLWIGKQKIKLPPMTQLPDRLLPFVHYIPVD